MAPIVCLHGLGRTASDWDGVRAGLSSCGEASTPALARDPTEAIAQIDAAIPPGAVVIGHSMGGVLALRLALERPRPLRAVVLTGCFFPPARNGRGRVESARDYLARRLAYLRAQGVARPGSGSRAGTAGAIAGLARLGLRRGEFDAAAAAVGAPVLVVHSRDDHHVPVDFAIAAASRHPGWELRLSARGGHHAHLTEPGEWLARVEPWLRERR